MKTYFERPICEQELITNAYEFERQAIEDCSSAKNPYFEAIMQLPDGKEIWEGLNEALEMAFA